MSTATLEVSGPEAARWAADLRATLAANIPSGDHVSPVDVQRSAELVVAVIGLVFAGVDSAKTIWNWWQSRRPEGAIVEILLRDGTRVNVSGVSQDQLETLFRRHGSDED